MSKTVVGLFSSMAQAEQVEAALATSGYPAKVIANESGTVTSGTEAQAEGVGQKISNFFHGLSGGDEDVHNHYATGVNTGGALVGVTCDDAKAAEVATLLRQHGAREVEGKSTGDTQQVAETSTTTAGQTAIPIVEEQLQVGKREVDRGGVRVYSHVAEKPVTADVTLRDETIVVERRPVNRAATAADFNMGQGSTIELNATGEEAVVGKSARVVEEVLVGKASSSHTEVIHDSVRRTEVEVEKTAAGNVASTKPRN